MADNPLRKLPCVNEVVESVALQALIVNHARHQVVAAVREELTELRQRLRQGEACDGQTAVEEIALRAAARLAQRLQPRLRTVINATGILLHTNLGRAPLAEQAA